MRLPTELKWACAVCAPALGAAFMSGREAATFFAVTGWASWIGVIISAVVFGLIMGMLCHFGKETGARTLPGIYLAKMDQRCGEAVAIIHCLLMLMMGAVALTTAGELGALSLDIKNAAIIASAGAVILGLMFTLRGLIPLASLGMLCVPFCIVFFIVLALDKRPAAAGVYIQNNMMDVTGSVSVAVFMGAMFAFLKAAISGSIALSQSHALVPWRFGIACSIVMALTAGCANWALQAAGPEVWALNLPFVVLAARWGALGYYISIYIMYLGCIAVVSCAIGSMCGICSHHLRRPAGALLATAGIMLMSMTGLRPLVNVGYPMLGWVCTLLLMALGVFYERRKSTKNASFPIK